MKNILVVLLLLNAVFLQAQEVVLITKESVIAKVKADNSDIKISEQEVLAAKGDLTQTNAIILPSIGLSYTGIATTNPLNAFGSKLNQGIITQNDFNPDLLNNPSQIENYTAKIEISQPLINMDGIFQRKAAKAKLNATRLQSQRVEDYMTLEVENAYMQLQLAYKTVDVLQIAKKTATEHKRIAQNSFEQGYLQKSDLLVIEVRVTEVDNQLQYAKSNIENASNYLSVLMNEPVINILKPVDSLNIEDEYVSGNELNENRSDIQAMKFGLEAYKQQHNANKMSFLPRLNAFGNYEFNDEEIFSDGTDGYLFGAQLSWNILEGTKRFGKAQKSKAEFEKSKIQYNQYVAQSQLELNKAQRMFMDAKNNVILAQLAMEQSKESFRIRNNRFKEGLEKTTDVLMAETQYSQKQLEYYNAIYKHNYALAYLKFLTQQEQ
ncbi:TolC family protein [Abyssalbus ytuae]|uniref:TolC family protein n=1 Tax=Abyssalbus ytuae TaxID=2926907 RepID=A0A9E6ZKU1_9FLAO|nr:TolC family protein [Abyssalbus ytuae]UOB17597.1 TolC family protein [Abyssalbus ytuae]